MWRLVLASASFLLVSPSFQQEYTPDWDSLDSRPLPPWYDEAKIGIFMHLGPYSVPGVGGSFEKGGAEWFWLHSTNPHSISAKYLRDYFPPKFTYQDFGAMLTMEFFDAKEIAEMVRDAGAKYFVFTSKHHDGFANWPSTHNFGWNSVAVGPERDVVGELAGAFREFSPEVHFGLYYSLYEWFHPKYLLDKESGFVTRDYPESKMIPELKEVVTSYEPEILWSDGEWEATSEYFGSKDFLAWLYNESPVKDYVVTNDRWGYDTRLAHGGFYCGPDRYNPGTLQEHKWENAMTVDTVSWGVRRDIHLRAILTMDELLGTVIETVSCGGNMLINVGPTKEGNILPIFQERLRSLGDWLKVNGEAIYSSTPWQYQNDTANSQVWYTAKGDSVYAFSLGWPEEDQLILGALGVPDPAEVQIQMLGLPDQDLSFSITEDNLVSVAFPSMSRLRSSCGPGCDWAYVLRISGLKTPSTTSTTSPAVTSGQPMTNGAHQLRQLPPLLVAAVSMAMLSKGRAEM